MITFYQLKPAFQRLLRPIASWLAFRGITANEITLAAIILSLVGGLLVGIFPTHQWPMLFIPIILFLRMVLNALDGLLAREHAMQSDTGIFLNELGDVLSDTFLYLPFALVPKINAMLVISIVILAIISEMMGVLAIQVSNKRRYDGPMGKSDRAFVFGLIGILLGMGVKAGSWLTLLLIIVNIALIVTIKKRIGNALQKFKASV